MVHAQDVLHQVVGLTDQLHVTVFDAVVDHFNKMTRALVSNLPQRSTATSHDLTEADAAEKYF